jgi:hypothetical protein
MAEETTKMVIAASSLEKSASFYSSTGEEPLDAMYGIRWTLMNGGTLLWPNGSVSTIPTNPTPTPVVTGLKTFLRLWPKNLTLSAVGAK